MGVLCSFTCSVYGRVASGYVFQPAYSEMVPESRNRDGCGKKGVQRKNTLGAWLGLLALIFVAAASGHTVRIVTADQQLSNGLVKSRIRQV